MRKLCCLPLKLFVCVASLRVFSQIALKIVLKVFYFFTPTCSLPVLACVSEFHNWQETATDQCDVLAVKQCARRPGPMWIFEVLKLKFLVAVVPNLDPACPKSCNLGGSIRSWAFHPQRVKGIAGTQKKWSKSVFCSILFQPIFCQSTQKHYGGIPLSHEKWLFTF